MRAATAIQPHSRMQFAMTALFTAALFGSWALCTPVDPGGRSATDTAGNRFVGSNLHFSNPFLAGSQTAQFPAGGNTAIDPQGFDLGDVAMGSQVSRYISAVDGVIPYIFITSTAGSLGLTLAHNGHLTGAFTFGGPSLVAFNAVVTDAAKATRTGAFFLKPNSSGFHFAIDALPQASLGQDYDTQIETIGGDTTTVTYSVVPNSVKINGAATTDLETSGLKLFRDGFIAGRPLISGTVQFTAQAVRSNGVHALNRAQTGADQTYTINVLTINSVQSELATLSSTIKAGNGFRDRFTLKADINTNGLDEFKFANKPFTLRVGNQVFSTTLNSSGQSRTGDITVSLRGLKGQLSVSLRNHDLSTIFDTPSIDRTNQTIIVQITMGDDFLATESIGYTVRNRRNRPALSYNIGHQFQLGGLFQITGVKARDFSNGTAFRVNFLISHVKGNTNTIFGTPQSATVFVGPKFSENVSFFRGRGVRLPPPGIQSLSLNLKRKTGVLNTYPLASSDTGVAPGSQGVPQTFLMGLSLQTDQVQFNGEASAQLIPARFGR